MSEEIKKTETEINDAELEGVSGGSSREVLAEEQRLCNEGSRMQPDSCFGEQEAGNGTQQNHHHVQRGRLS